MENKTHQANAIHFADVATRLATDHDVLMCYQILLGRNPEDSFVIQEAKTQQLRCIFDGFVRSGEFADRVSRPFGQGEPLLHDTESLGPSAEQLAWLKRSLKLNRKAAAGITAAQTWRALFLVLFTLPGFRPPPQHPALSQLLGAVDSLTSSLVRGWCMGVARSGEPVILAMLADGDVMGHCECQLPRPDVQAVLGGDGSCGFEFNIPESFRERAFVLSAQDATSGAPVIGPLLTPASPAALSDKVAVLQGRLGRLDMLMRQVAGELSILANEVQSLATVLSQPAALPEPQTTELARLNEEFDPVVAGV